MPIDKNGKPVPLKIAPLMHRCLHDRSKRWRYRVVFGGRGKSASWGIADHLIETAVRLPARILCTRQIQISIRDSVHKLLSDRIEALGYSKHFTITDTEIRGYNGSSFIFRGLKTNMADIKSMERIHYCWVAEAESVTDDSWTILTPTIRTEWSTCCFGDVDKLVDGLYFCKSCGKTCSTETSEIIVDFNPAYEDDATYKRFVVNPPENSLVVYMTYKDNPFFPQVLETERKTDEEYATRTGDWSSYNHKWLGKCKGQGSRIWTSFERTVHIKDFSMEEIATKGNCYMAIDPHSKYYPFCLWLAVIPKDNRGREYFRVVYNEYPSHNLLGGYYSDQRKKLLFSGSLSDLAREIYILDGTAQHGIKILDRFIDTRYAKGAGGENWSTSTTGIIDEFAKPVNGGLRFTCPAEKIIDAQRSVIIEAMKYNHMIPIGNYNCPDFYVMPHCLNLIQSIENHRCIDNSEKEDETYKDPSDALRILFAGMTGKAYSSPVEETSDEDAVYDFGSNNSTSWMA